MAEQLTRVPRYSNIECLMPKGHSQKVCKISLELGDFGNFLQKTAHFISIF